MTKITFGNKHPYSSDMNLDPGEWVKGDVILSTDELADLSSIEPTGT